MDELTSEIVPVPEGQIARFGSFELYIDTGELRKHGVRVKLQGKSFQILRALVENPGRVVSREDLRARLWPADTFVDFESGLNTAANRLRSTLGDSADSPIYIETLPRIGYRFVAPVTILQAPQNGHARVLPSALELEPPTAITTTPLSLVEPMETQPIKHRVPYGFLVAMGAVLIAGIIGLVYWLSHKATKPSLAFRQVTFKSGSVGSARFTPDGKDIVYSAEWGEDGSRVYETSLSNPDAHDLGYREAWLAGISPSTNLGVFHRSNDGYAMTLEQAPLTGGSPQLVAKGVLSADYGPNQSLCLISVHGREFSLEYPPGKRLYTTNNWITHPRVSPRGDAIAFLEHPIPLDDAGNVMLIDINGATHVLSTGWASVAGVAWANSGKEILFTAAKSGVERQLMGVDRAGHLHQVMRTPGTLEVQDISKTGDVLLARSTERMSMSVVNLAQNSVKTVSRFDWSRAMGISADGDSVLLDESGEGGGTGYSVYLYHVHNQSFSRLGEGRAMDLSPDGRWAITEPSETTSTIKLVSTDGKKQVNLPNNGVKYVWVKFLPNSQEILFYGNLPGQPSSMYRQKLPDGQPTLAFEDILMEEPVIDSSGEIAVARAPGPSMVLLHLATGAKRIIRINQQVTPVAVISEKKILVRMYEKGFLTLYQLDPTTGVLTPYRRIPDPSTPQGMVPMYISQDSGTLVFSKRNVDSDLVVATGLTEAL